MDSVDDMDTEDMAADSSDLHGQTAGNLDSLHPAQVKSEDQTTGEAKNFWDAMHQRPQNARDESEEAVVDNSTISNSTFDDLSEPVIVKVWGRVYESDHNHLFGEKKVDAPLSSLHPSHVQIFRLWQIYSDNVNPLLKVTHAPTLQARILDAAVDVAGISHELEALMFSIYCAAIISLSEEECVSLLGGSKAERLRRYQDACHQALINCGFLRSRDRDCLTAFFLYLVRFLQYSLFWQSADGS